MFHRQFAVSFHSGKYRWSRTHRSHSCSSVGSCCGMPSGWSTGARLTACLRASLIGTSSRTMSPGREPHVLCITSQLHVLPLPQLFHFNCSVGCVRETPTSCTSVWRIRPANTFSRLKYGCYNSSLVDTRPRLRPKHLSLSC